MKYIVAVKHESDEVFTTDLTIDYGKTFEFHNYDFDESIRMIKSLHKVIKSSGLTDIEFMDNVVDKCKRNCSKLQIGDLVFVLL